MKIRLNDDKETVALIQEGLKAKDGYCPCRVGKLPEYKCMCEEFRKQIADPEFEDGEYGEGVFFNRDFFERNLTQVAYFTEEDTVIYKIY